MTFHFNPRYIIYVLQKKNFFFITVSSFSLSRFLTSRFSFNCIVPVKFQWKPPYDEFPVGDRNRIDRGIAFNQGQKERLISVFSLSLEKPARRLSRQNRIPAATRSRVPVAQRFPVRPGFPRVPLHPVHPPFVRPVLHTRAGLLSRAAGPHAAAGQPHVRAILAGTGTELAGR